LGVEVLTESAITISSKYLYY